MKCHPFYTCCFGLKFGEHFYYNFTIGRVFDYLICLQEAFGFAQIRCFRVRTSVKYFVSFIALKYVLNSEYKNG